MPRVDPVEFEQLIADKWAVDRGNIYSEGLGSPDVIRAASPVRPEKAMQLLNVSQTELVSLLKSGKLCRPGKFGLGRVAWRRDEIQMLRELLLTES
jgi:predicted DNA-binding transcriptional regulator AlpA